VTDDEFVQQFFASLDGGFHHRDHLHLTWLAIGRGTPELVGPAIQRFAAAHGQERKYHETLTTFWVRIVAHARSVHPELDFDDFLDAVPQLLDATIATRHWTGEALWSEDARAAWREPDLLPLPA
jgi:hypothetical protein